MRRGRIVSVVILMVALGFGGRSVMANEVMPLSYTFSPVGIHQGTWLYDDPGFSKLTDGVYGSDVWASDYAGHNPGTYNGGPWVGWWGINWDGSGFDKTDYTPNDIQIVFHFAPGTEITGMSIGTNQDARYNWNVVFPAAVTIRDNHGFQVAISTPFSLSNSGDDLGTGYNVGRRHAINLSFPAITPDTITLVLNNAAHFQGLTWDGSTYIKDGIRWDNNPWPGSIYNGMFWIFVDEVDFYGKVTPIPVPASSLLLATGLTGLLWQRWKRKG